MFSTCNTAEANAKVGPPDPESRKETNLKRAEQEMLYLKCNQNQDIHYLMLVRRSQRCCGGGWHGEHE